MSLINDALKQIKEARQQNPPPSPPPLSPVESNSPKASRWFVPGAVVLLVAAAGVFVGISLSKPRQLAASAVNATTHRAPVTVSSIATQQTARLSVAAPASNGVGSNATVADMVSPKPPGLKLQGVLYAAMRPCAIVNGRTVFTGDRVNGFRVMLISRDSITLRSETETRVLSLNRH